MRSVAYSLGDVTIDTIAAVTSALFIWDIQDHIDLHHRTVITDYSVRRFDRT